MVTNSCTNECDFTLCKLNVFSRVDNERKNYLDNFLIPSSCLLGLYKNSGVMNYSSIVKVFGFESYSFFPNAYLNIFMNMKNFKFYVFLWIYHHSGVGLFFLAISPLAKSGKFSSHDNGTSLK